MYSNILVPIVFEHGNHGSDALKVADKLLATGGKITLLHILEDVPAYAAAHIPEGIRDHHRQDATEGLKELAGNVSSDCEAIVTHGHASSGILDFAKSHDVDCIVLASHKPGFEDYFLGSTAARVVRHAKCGVHVLR